VADLSHDSHLDSRRWALIFFRVFRDLDLPTVRVRDD
jgi:hypothetical protein